MLRFYSFLVLILFLSCRQKPEHKINSVHEDSNEELTEEDFNYENIFSDEVEGWKNLREGNLFHLDIRYATDNNFVNEVLYDCGKCYLRKAAGNALEEIAKSLNQHGFKIVLFDCYRPKPIQQRLWDKVPNPSYVTPPAKGSMHNRGLAVDLSIMDDMGEYLNMGTEYDFFGEEAHTDNTNLPEEVLKNRKLLNDLMVKYGFKGIRTEWWHFSFVDSSHEIADWEWDCP